MGLNIGTALFLVKPDSINQYKKHSADNQCSILMIGRQWMSTDKKDFKELSKYNSSLRPESLESGVFAENFLRDLGATSVNSLDSSDFESAEIIHNLNEAFEGSKIEKFKGAYDIVLDYGTSEHVFQPAQSIAISISLLKLGGVYNCTLPISGWLEHGMYQFSPTLFRSLDHPPLRLNRMYIYSPYTNNVQIWDAKVNPNNPYYDRLKERLSCWAHYTKVSEINEKEFLQNTHQEVYKKAWARFDSQTELQKVEKQSKWSLIKNSLLKNSYFLQKYFIKSKRIKIHDIPSF